MMQFPAAHVVFVSSVKYGQVTSSGQASGKEFELGEYNLHICKTSGNLSVSLTGLTRLNLKVKFNKVKLI